MEEAIELLASSERAKALAGGTDIIVQLREGLREADLVVDVKKIPELQALEFDSRGALKLGASVPAYKLYENKQILLAYPALADSARIIGGWQIQSRASIGGNLCNASPAADSTPSLIALGASCHIAGPGGRRTMPVHQFCIAPGRNVLAAGEMLVAIEFPPPEPNASSHYQRFIPRNEMDIAAVGCGCWLKLNAAGDTIEAGRIALGAVAPTPLLAEEASNWLAGQPAGDATFKQAGVLARHIATPITDMRGTKEYRLHLVGVLVERTLRTAAERANAAR